MARRKETQDAIDQARILSRIDGLEWAARHVMQHAQRHFSCGEDDVARRFRVVSKEITAERDAARRKYDERWHPEFLKGQG